MTVGGAALLLTTLLIGARSVSAKPEYTRKTTKNCAFCHQPPGYNLNEAGKYYVDHSHSLAGRASQEVVQGPSPESRAPYGSV